MTSLALAHAAPAPAFNGLFYATAATVIPVLYIALTVQGQAGTGLARTAARILYRSRPATAVGTIPAGVILWTAGAAIIVFGAIAEIAAIWSLYDGQDVGPGAKAYIWGTTIFLVAAAATGPLWGLFQGFLEEGFPEKDSTGGGAPPQTPAAMPGATPPPQPGKPDPA